MPMQFCLKSLWFSYLLCLCCNCKESRLGNAFLSSLCSGNVHKSRSVPALSLEGCACVPLNFTLILLLFVGFLHFTNCSSCRHTWDIDTWSPWHWVLSRLCQEFCRLCRPDCCYRSVASSTWAQSGSGISVFIVTTRLTATWTLLAPACKFRSLIIWILVWSKFYYLFGTVCDGFCHFLSSCAKFFISILSTFLTLEELSFFCSWMHW